MELTFFLWHAIAIRMITQSTVDNRDTIKPDEISIMIITIESHASEYKINHRAPFRRLSVITSRCAGNSVRFLGNRRRCS